MKSVTTRAFAKINLSLRVGPSRADGYHDLQTVFQSIELSDRLKIESRRGPFQILCAARGVPTDRSNLIWQAAEKLWTASGRPGSLKDTRVTLEKRIPIAAGLGGGSSDAASALVGLRRLWRAPVDDGAIRAMASSLGADVPYFLVGGTALGLGRGDEIYPLAQLPDYWAVLAVPSFGVASRDAYRWLDEDRRKGTLEPMSTRPGGVLSQFPGITFSNDLEVPVVLRHPMIGDLIGRLERCGALLTAMSGSGSTVFGVFDSAGRARLAARAIGETGVRALRSRFLRRKSD